MQKITQLALPLLILTDGKKIIDEANLNIPNYWQMTSKNGKGTFVQVGTKWIVTVPTMTQVLDAPAAYWGVKLATETEYTIQFGISNGTNDDSVYVNVSDTPRITLSIF